MWKKATIVLAACLVGAQARADVKDDVRSCARNDAQCVGLALADFMEQGFRRIANLIRANGDDGDDDDGGSTDQVLAAGLYTLQTGSGATCTSLDVQPRLSGGVLRRVDVTCLPASSLIRMDCQDAFSCADGAGNSLEVYDNDTIDVTINGRYAVYELIPGLYDGSVRLVGTGILEIFHNGEWRGVCDDSFTSVAGEVACRQLGSTYVSHSGNQTHNSGFWLDEVICSGHEAGLARCQHSGWGSHNCSSNEYIAMQCQ